MWELTGQSTSHDNNWSAQLANHGQETRANQDKTTRGFQYKSITFLLKHFY